MRRRGNLARVLSLLALLTGLLTTVAYAQSEAEDSAAMPAATGFEALVGQWVRPDGGYMVTIRSAGADGKLDASYANPAPLAFSRAEAIQDGEKTRVFLELTDDGYNGSTYTLTFDPEADVLRGVYYQANAQQNYEIFFVRVP